MANAFVFHCFSSGNCLVLTLQSQDGALYGVRLLYHGKLGNSTTHRQFVVFHSCLKVPSSFAFKELGHLFLFGLGKGSIPDIRGQG